MNDPKRSNRLIALAIVVALFLIILIAPLYIYIYNDILTAKKGTVLTDTNVSSSAVPFYGAQERGCCIDMSRFCCDKNTSEENITIVERPDDPCKLRTHPTKEQLEMAKIAWKYIENNYNEKTGLINAADKYPSASVWDWANAIYAVYAAKKFGLIDQHRFETMINKFLETMQSVRLFNNELPNKTYNTESMLMTDYGNNVKDEGIGWSVADLARLMSALNLLEQCEETLNPAIEKLLLRYRYCRSAGVDGNMYGASYEDGQVSTHHETLTGYEEYLARSYELWGFDLSEARSYKFMKLVELYGVKIPVETRDFYSAFVGSESYWYTGFDYGLDDNESGKYIESIYKVQEARYKATSQFTAITEDHINQKPYFLYNTIYEDAEPWKTTNHNAQDYADFRAVSTKAAIGMRYLFDTNYTRKLFDYIDDSYDKGKGYYAGIFETKPGINSAVTLNTNAVILESLLFANLGPLQELNKIESRGLFDHYRNTVNNFRCLPRDTNFTVLEPYSTDIAPADVTERDIGDARIAWKFFENNYNPQTGIVNAYHHYEIIGPDAIGKTIMGTIAAHQLGIIDDQGFHERTSKLMETLKRLPLYNNELPNIYYDASKGIMTKEFGEEDSNGSGWDLYNIAHLMTGLYHLQAKYPEFAGDVCEIASRFNFDRADKGGLNNARIVMVDVNVSDANGSGSTMIQVPREKLKIVSDLAQDYYIHTALKLFDINSYNHFVDDRHLDYKRVYDYEVPMGYWQQVTNAETYLWAMMEHPYYLKYKHYSSNIYLAQKQRYMITGKITTSSYEHLDQAPFFVANDIYNDGRHWSDFNRKNEPLNDFATYSTKAAFIYDALYGYTDEYGRLLRDSVEDFYYSSEGWYGGYYMDFKRVNKSVNIFTNAAVLESILYKKTGNFYYALDSKLRERIAMHKHLAEKERYSITSPTIKLFGYAKDILKRFRDKELVRIERINGDYVVKIGSFASGDEARAYLADLNITLPEQKFDKRYLNDEDDRTFRVVRGDIDSDDFLWANRYYRYDYRLPYENEIIYDNNLSFELSCKIDIKKKSQSPNDDANVSTPLFTAVVAQKSDGTREEPKSGTEKPERNKDSQATLTEKKTHKETPKGDKKVSSEASSRTPEKTEKKIKKKKKLPTQGSNPKNPDTVPATVNSQKHTGHTATAPIRNTGTAKKKLPASSGHLTINPVEQIVQKLGDITPTDDYLKEISKYFKEPKEWLHGTITYNSSLKNISKPDATRQDVRLTLNLTPIDHFLASTTLIADTNRYKNVDYQPDFYYVFGYVDYTPGAWSFFYSNYENNKFSSDPNAADFRDGTWELNYKTMIEKVYFTTKFRYRPSEGYKILGFSGSRKLTDTLSGSASLDHFFDHRQDKLTLSLKKNFSDDFFVEGKVFFFSNEAEREDYEGDYSLVIGYKKGPFSITYSNEYEETRWPWSSEKGFPLSEGKISFSYSF